MTKLADKCAHHPTHYLAVVHLFCSRDFSADLRILREREWKGTQGAQVQCRFIRPTKVEIDLRAQISKRPKISFFTFSLVVSGYQKERVNIWKFLLYQVFFHLILWLQFTVYRKIMCIICHILCC